MEMAQTHRRLGCEVTVIEGQRALGKDDPELAAIALEHVRAEGVTILENASVARVGRTGDDITVTTENGQNITGSHLLMAVGRKSSHDRLNLEAAGVKTTRNGIKTDASLKTTNRKIYAIGDAAGGLQFTHVANYHAGIVIRSALFGLPAKTSDAHIPWATYTDPELAQVGLTEAEARKKHGRNLEVLRFEFAGTDRARTENISSGLVKVMVAKGRPVGAGIVGPQAGEQISLWALAISAKLRISTVAGMVTPYPTLMEASKRAAGQYYVPRLFENEWVRKIVGLVQKLP